MHIRLKDRIRLNNAIWRCWFIECELLTLKRFKIIHKSFLDLNVGRRSVGQRSKRKLIPFITPLDSDVNDRDKPEVNVIIMVLK